jgi:hypothetical protein
VITLPPDAKNLYGKSVKVNVDADDMPPRKNSFEGLCDTWCADERSAEEIVRDIYSSRANESFEEFCARYDQVGISTKGWKFDREELYGDRL